MISPVQSRTAVAPAVAENVYNGAQVSVPLWWPAATPTTSRDYYLDATAVLTEESDSLTFASVRIAPSGLGEMQPVAITSDGYVVQITLSGGVARRVYTAWVQGITSGNRSWSWYVEIIVAAAPGVIYEPVPPSPSPFYGTPIVWNGTTAPAYAILGADGRYLLGADGKYLQYQGTGPVRALLGADGKYLLSSTGEYLQYAP